MKPELTESTFAFAFSNELVKKLNLLTVPNFISQQSEALKGYDVKFNWKEPIFIQFKISDYLYGRNASEIKLFKKKPYFRFKLHQDKSGRLVYNQHNLLLKLNKKHKHVYYCAPIFHKKDELNKYFQNNKLTDNSVLFKPKQMGNVWRQTQHRIVYNKDLSFCYFLSRPKKIEGSKFFILESRESVNLDRKYWLNIMKEIKSRVMIQIEDNSPRIKKIEDKTEKTSYNLPSIISNEIDYSYELEQKKRKIQAFTDKISEYDYAIMLKEIEKFLETELGIYILL